VESTPLIDAIYGYYCIQPTIETTKNNTSLAKKSSSQMSNTSISTLQRDHDECSISFSLFTRLKIPGFLQPKIKSIVVDVAMGELIKFCQSPLISKITHTPTPVHLQLPTVSDEEDHESIADNAILERFKQLWKQIKTSLASNVHCEEESMAFHVIYRSFQLSQHCLSVLDAHSFQRRIQRLTSIINYHMEHGFEYSQKILSLFNFKSLDHAWHASLASNSVDVKTTSAIHPIHLKQRLDTRYRVAIYPRYLK
jgi:hypothetical protein